MGSASDETAAGRVVVEPHRLGQWCMRVGIALSDWLLGAIIAAWAVALAVLVTLFPRRVVLDAEGVVVDGLWRSRRVPFERITDVKEDLHVGLSLGGHRGVKLIDLAEGRANCYVLIREGWEAHRGGARDEAAPTDQRAR